MHPVLTLGPLALVLTVRSDDMACVAQMDRSCTYNERHRRDIWEQVRMLMLMLILTPKLVLDMDRLMVLDSCLIGYLVS